MGDLFVSLLALFFLSLFFFFIYYFLIFLFLTIIFILYFNDSISIYFIFSFFLSFFLSFLLIMWLTGSCCSGRVSGLYLWGGSIGQGIDPPEISQFHRISNGKNSPTSLHLNATAQLHSRTSKLKCWTPCAKKSSKTGTKPHPLAERLPKIIIRSQKPPKHTTRRGHAHQKDKTQPHPPEHRHQSPPAGSLNNSLKQL